ncbi:hypothetical protein [Cupriavidus necator]|uniref:hypothetical protein n=1 Tax=Cupriavidus necator TaxID=106590 RepID=UPI00068EA236|nr:hypothetical protein [Cupriavidus necator]
MAAIPSTQIVREHAAALARILGVTREAWSIGTQAPDCKSGRDPCFATWDCQAARRRLVAQSAARALMAQIMVLRCRQAFVA